MRTRVLLAIILLVASTSALSAETFPSVGVTTLGGTHLRLPQALHGHPSLLVIGFTQTAEKQTSEWRKRVQADLAGTNGLVVYPVIVIQQIPGFFHRLLIAGIRAGVRRSMWKHFLVVAHDAAAWKAAIGWRQADIAYLVLLDRHGRIVWRHQGHYSLVAEGLLGARLAALGHTSVASQ